MSILNLSSSSEFTDVLKNIINATIQLESYPSQEVCISFSGQKFFHPVTLAGLALLKQLPKYNNRLQFHDITNPAVLSYCNTIYFPQTLDVESHANIGNILREYQSKSYIPITKIDLHASEYNDSSNSNYFIQNVQGQLFKAQLRKVARGLSAYESISYIISELTDNMVSHSLSQHGYVVSQLYPNLGYLDIALVDLGQGYLSSYQKSVRHHYPHVVCEFSAMKAAMIEALSSKDEAIGRGFGLKTSRSIISGLDNRHVGRFFAWSGRAYYLERSGVQPLIGALPVPWHGVFIMMRIPVLTPSGFDFKKFVVR